MSSNQTFAAIGHRILGSIHMAGRDLIMLSRAILWTRSAWTKRRDIVRQCYAAGIESLAVTAFVGMFAGMILALSAGIELAKYGQQDVVGALVAVSMCREMGPFMCALILTANVGSSMAAEIGTMSDSEEIDALEVMSIDVNRFIVMPRVVAMVVATPLLTVVVNIIGNIGAAVVAYAQLGVTFTAYYYNAMQFIDLMDVYTGLFKAVVFGLVIATIGCGKGLRTTGGAIGVGNATRSCVITCFLLIMVLGYVITFIFFGGDLMAGT